MVLPGKAIEKIRTALKSAFPNRDKLVRMLRIHLDIEESDVPDNSDYSQVIFDLIIRLEQEGWISDLIEGALKEVPGNSALQNLPEILIQIINEKLTSKDDDSLIELVQKLNICSLYILLIKLINLDEKFFRQIKQLYLKSYSELVWYEDWEDTIPSTITEILSSLKKKSQNNEIEYIVNFVSCLSKLLLEQEKNSNPILEQLKIWLQRNTNNCSTLSNSIVNPNTVRNELNTVPTHLLILLSPSQQHQNQYYFVSAWFIHDGRNDEFNYQTAKGYKRLELQNQEKEIFSLTEISILIDDYIEQVIPYLNDNSAQPTIEIFLPYGLLNEAIDTWKIQNEDFPVSMGSLYKVILRSSNRLNKYRFRNVWVQKWNTLISLTQDNCFQCFISGEFSSSAELFSKINQDDVVALTLIKAVPTEDYFKAINTTALPLALWFRQELNVPNFENEIKELLKCLITEIPERVRQRRSSDFSCDYEQRIGHHLSLLWENPYIVPPSKKEYTTP
ncbi:effector-associated domain EAD1-containing protein [Aulosira sp. FACHB-615]|uniref:VMAP-C domain-containing protein n=2 Tax=Nostocales TaxID=1161 RepID=UPI0016831F81|nr:effector-associated domain EAD1-containing protein [Aulosira sp. FACHB-615]MBD2491682.1 hypothetical protein [Aulosira sp. FACHB-615]